MIFIVDLNRDLPWYNIWQWVRQDSFAKVIVKLMAYGL